MKRLLFIVALFSINQTAKPQRFFDKLTGTVNRITNKADTLNQKTNNLKAKTDSTKSTINALRGKRNQNNNLNAQNNPNYTSSNSPMTNAGTGGGRSKDQLDFVLTGCIGDLGSQTVTVYFTIGNPVKVNQSVGINTSRARSVDMDGDQYRPKAATLANGNGSWIELPTGITAQGSITFSNVLPREKQLAIVEFTIGTRNYDGGGDYQNKPISLKNLAINWQ